MFPQAQERSGREQLEDGPILTRRLRHPCLDPRPLHDGCSVGLTLVLVRLRPPPVYDIQITSEVDDDFSGRILIADDGDEIRP